MAMISRLVRNAKSTVALPVATFPGIAISGTSVRDLVTNAELQVRTQLELHRRFNTAALLSCMDLSVEAEAFGASIQFSDTEVPTVTGRLVTDARGAEAVRLPEVGEGRTSVYLDAVRGLARAAGTGGNVPVLAGMIGPFSLAGRLFGVSEALLATASEPGAIDLLLDKSTAFLTAYAAGFKEAGASGLIMAEPTAGLLSPRALATYSSPFVQRILEAVEDDGFEIILHNCGARAVHLDAIAASGARLLHFGAPMDIRAALEKLSPDRIVCGNLDPAGVFVQSSAATVASRTRALLEATSGFSNFVISSGCDIPAGAPLENLEAFFRVVRQQPIHV